MFAKVMTDTIKIIKSECCQIFNVMTWFVPFCICIQFLNKKWQFIVKSRRDSIIFTILWKSYCNLFKISYKSINTRFLLSSPFLHNKNNNNNNGKRYSPRCDSSDKSDSEKKKTKNKIYCISKKSFVQFLKSHASKMWGNYL